MKQGSKILKSFLSRPLPLLQLRSTSRTIHHDWQNRLKYRNLFENQVMILDQLEAEQRF